jgi:hypothetical protein
VDAIGKNYTGGAEMLAVADLSVPSGTDVTKGVKVTLSVSGITSTDNIRVLHQNSSGTWEELPIVSVGNGSVTVKMTSFSPVAVVRVKGTQTSSSDSGSGTNNNGTDSSAANNGSNTNPPPTNDQSGSTTTNNNSQSNSQNQSNSQTNSNNQSNSQTNNQNNPVTVNQNVTVNYPDAAYSYEETYADGYVAGSTTVKGSTSGQTQTGSTGTGTGSTISGSVTSPKTGASLPALPILAVFAFAGILACGKKAQRQ